MSYELRNRPPSPWSLCALWLSGRASECEIQSSEVQFLVGTQNFFCPMLVRRRKKIFLNSERVALPGDEISFVVDNTSFPKAIQIMVVNNTDFSDFN